MVPVRVIINYYHIIGYILGYILELWDKGKENGNYYNGFYGWLSKLWSLFGVP